ncbi:MAG: NADH dehydrogenase subunit D, partial [Actinomycetota bacterium]
MSTDNMSAEDVVYESGVGDDAYADSYDTGEGRVFTLSGGDWDTVTPPSEGEKERIVVNMGPQHPSTHGVLRFVVKAD